MFMFVQKIEDKYKSNFLDLVWYLINCDDEVADAEIQILNNFKFELQLFVEPELKPLSTILAAFAGATSTTKKIILIESAGVSWADGTVVPEEMNVLQEIAQSFSLTESDVQTSLSLVKQILDVHQDTVKFIHD